MNHIIELIVFFLSGLFTGLWTMFEYVVSRQNKNLPPFPDNVIRFRQKKR